MTKNILKLFLISFLFSANVFAVQVEEINVQDELINSIIELINLEDYNEIDTKFAAAESKIKEYAADNILTDKEKDVLTASVQNKLETQDGFDKEAIKGKIANLFTKNTALLKEDTQYQNLNKTLINLLILLNKPDESVNLQDGHGNKFRIFTLNNFCSLTFVTAGAVTISYILYYHNPQELKQMLSSQAFWESIWQNICTQIQNIPGYAQTGYGYAQTGFNCTVQAG